MATNIIKELQLPGSTDTYTFNATQLGGVAASSYALKTDIPEQLTIKSLNTNNSTTLSVNSSESITGTGSISLHKVSKTGSYNDLLNTPELATVATSGSYDDLKNKPTIPSAYTLPLAANGTRGGIQIGYSASGANIPVALSNEKAYVALTRTAANTAGFNESYLSWGGKSLADTVSPIGCALSTEHSANKLAFISGNAITMEWSADAGSTWTDFNYTAAQKSSFCTLSYIVPIGRATLSTNMTVNCKTRITITGQDGTNSYVYTQPTKLLTNVGLVGKCSLLVEARTGTNYQSDGAWVTLGTYLVSGWTGWNDIPCVMPTLGGGTTQLNNYWQLRLTYTMTELNSSYLTDGSINSIRLFGVSLWASPSTMASTGHLYSYDISQNATFPNSIYPHDNEAQDLGLTTKKWRSIYCKQLSATSIYENGTLLSNKYALKTAIPTVNNNTITINKNGSKVDSFTLNQTTDKTIDITVPTKISELTNDSGFTSNTGTVTSVAVKVNGTIKGTITTSGTIDLGTLSTTDTKNTAGATNSTSKLFLIGAISQTANPQTYSYAQTYIGTDGNLYSNGKKVALEENIPSTTNFVTLDTAQTITGIKTFNAPTNVSGTEQATAIFKTANGGQLIIGKEGPNSGTMLGFDQVAGTRRLNFRASSTAGALVWSQPEANSTLYYDVKNIQFREVTGISLAHFTGGFLKTNASGTLTVDTSTYSKTDTNYYHTTGTWSGLTYTAKANGGAGELKLTIPTGTTSTTVALGNHTHSNYADKDAFNTVSEKVNSIENSYFPSSGGTISGNLALTGSLELRWTTLGNGGLLKVDSSGAVSVDKNTYLTSHRTIQVNGTSIGNNTLNLKSGNNITLTNSNGTVTISGTGGGTSVVITDLTTI